MKRIFGVGAAIAFGAITFHQSAWSRDLLNYDLLLSPRWYIVQDDPQTTADELQYRAYAGKFSNSSGKVEGLVNLLTFTCSKSGHYFNFSFPQTLNVSALDGLRRSEVVQATIADYDLKEIMIINGRRSGDNSVYFDLANNDDDIFKVPDLLKNNLLILRSRVGETVINVVSEDGFAINVEDGLKKAGYAIDKSFENFGQSTVDCLAFSGVRFVE